MLRTAFTGLTCTTASSWTFLKQGRGAGNQECSRTWPVVPNLSSPLLKRETEKLHRSELLAKGQLAGLAPSRAAGIYYTKELIKVITTFWISLQFWELWLQPLRKICTTGSCIVDIGVDFTLHLLNRLAHIFDPEFSVFTVISRCSGICDFFLFSFSFREPKTFQVISFHSQLGLLDGAMLTGQKSELFILSF